MYWLIGPNMQVFNGKQIMAKWLDDPGKPWGSAHGLERLHQLAPYAKPPRLTLSVPQEVEHFDNLVSDSGFSLYSIRLLTLLERFDVLFESFPVSLVNERGQPYVEKPYHFFHLLEPTQSAYDAEQSYYDISPDDQSAIIVFRENMFEPRPYFVCDDIFMPFMSNELKLAIQAEGITGFEFIKSTRY